MELDPGSAVPVSYLPGVSAPFSFYSALGV